jgi:hypothetical protein
MEKSAKIRTFDVPQDSSTENSIVVKITEPALRAENLSLETWASSHVLARQLHWLPASHIPVPRQTSPPDPTVVPVLELGAGTGLVGISASLLWDVPVVLTDLAPIVPGLLANVTINAVPSSHEPKPRVACGTLDWNHPDLFTIAQDSPKSLQVYEKARKARVLLAADTIYSEEHPEMLANVMSQWLQKDADARLVICSALRVAYLDEIREMWQRLEDCGFETVAEGRETANEMDFDDERLCEWSVWKWKQDRLDAA